jgi:hypothetical protein
MLMKQSQRIFLTVFILLLPGIGYLVMSGLIYVIPLSSNNIVNILIYASLILAIGLLVPMWIVKLGVHVATMSDKREKELEFKNIAKDKDQLARSQRKAT